MYTSYHIIDMHSDFSSHPWKKVSSNSVVDVDLQSAKQERRLPSYSEGMWGGKCIIIMEFEEHRQRKVPSCIISR